MSKKRTQRDKLQSGKKHTNQPVRESQKRIVQMVSPDNYDMLCPSWRFCHCASGRKWDIGRSNWKLWEQDIVEILKSFEKMTWAEIKSASKSGRKGGSKSHNVSVAKLCPEARRELEQMKLQYDQIFSLRLGSVKRIYGFLENGVLHMLWYDDKHEIYPCKV